MIDSARAERRRAKRYHARLNLNVHLQLPGEKGSLDELETLNVSSSGLYFRSGRYIEPMTKLALSFDVPVDPDDSSPRAEVNCEGIVVRIVPEQPSDQVDSYEIAVFFTTIDAESLHHLEGYIAAALTA